MLLWKLDWEVHILLFSRGHIDARIRIDAGSLWRLTGLYGNLTTSLREDTWELIQRLRRVDNLPWLLGGDFNGILWMDENKGGSDKSILGVCQFRQVVDDCYFEDLGYSGPMMTWTNRRDGDQNIEERLDRNLGDSEWKAVFPNAKVVHLGYNFSDHIPILLKLDYEDKREWVKGCRGFRFEHFWLKDDDCEDIVKEVWAEYGMVNSIEGLRGKLAWCAAKLEAWSKFKFGSLQKKII
ncbi:hypothetical protein Dsin_001913 [Dipteronia sinensis]|uniref:Endonuclease/exonuclease/phosphatase domain-containing protein n=1 Tax=Dipteronia sinensis TaxID=43782 RepID=A0AAE0EJF5_9ROSI|nr:hypothetical protein Dsin_001913 [Dipteronia sinensis]